LNDVILERLTKPTLINPTFVTHAPKELIPLAKLSPDHQAEQIVASANCAAILRA